MSKKNKKQNRKSYIKIMVTPDEKSEIIKNAHGNTSEFIRNLALKNKRIRVNETKVDPALVEQVRRIGVSLNQIARAANLNVKSGQHLPLAQLYHYIQACNENLSRIIVEARHAG